MSSVEHSLLKVTNQLVDQAADEVAPGSDRADARLAVLEAVAAAHAGWSLDDFWQLTQPHDLDVRADPGPWADKILSSIAGTPIPIPLALSALSRDVLPAAQQRKTGAYYTDWRLAELLAAASVPKVKAGGPWLDPACGSGALLVAAGMAVPAGRERELLVREQLAGADLSPRALRGALLSVASLTPALPAVEAFRGRLLLQDSLKSQESWAELAPNGAALVIGNPPWEKLKVSRHETAQSQGTSRSYGQSFDQDIELEDQRQALLGYIDQVARGTRLQGGGEHDLYKLFMELGMAIAAEDGVLALLVPAGLIRAQGTEALRRELDRLAKELSISVIENRARNFAIDTRFKFLSVVARIGAGRRQPIALKVADRSGNLPDVSVKIRRAQLARIRPDLSLPEVKTRAEWDLYVRLAAKSITVGDADGPWRPMYRREVDMTLDQKSFVRAAAKGTLPLLEGRHVGQYRWRAKAYEQGEGRSAIWRPLDLRNDALRTQWFVPGDALHPASIARSSVARVGFCDITGQTNERSLLVSRIPAGVVCGNKVPTIQLPEGGADREDLFLALSNSFVVDWMLRRIVTTTVNFFLFDSLALPNIEETSATGRELITLARRLTAAEGHPKADLWQVGAWRARIDALVAAEWGLDLNDMRAVFADFPLLDRGQPDIRGEGRSTVTKDAVLDALAGLLDIQDESSVRLQNGREMGAVPYVPAEYA